MPLPLSLFTPLSSAKRHLARAFAWDLQLAQASEQERARLEKRGVSQESLHRFAVWRRSVLLVVLAPTAIAALLATAATLGQGREGLSQVGKALTLANALVIWALPISALLASCSWARIRRSHRILVAGWVVAFVPPFLIAMTPLGWWFDIQGSPDERASIRRELAALDMLNGLHVSFTLLPAALAVLPGLVRACLRVKTLLPAAILPGWFLVVAPPFYLLLALVALIALNHLAGSPLLVFGVVLFIGAPMIYVWRADLFVRPLEASECPAIDRVQRHAMWAGTLGAVLLIAYLFTKEVFGLRLMALDPERSLIWLLENRDSSELEPGAVLAQARSLFWVGDLSLFQVLIQYVGRSLFMTAVFADLLVRMSLSVWTQERQFAGTPAGKTYDETMMELEKLLGRG